MFSAESHKPDNLRRGAMNRFEINVDLFIVSCHTRWPHVITSAQPGKCHEQI